MALVVLASATISANAAEKKKKKKGAEAEAFVLAPVQLTSHQDSISYAAGMAATRGLMQYLQQNFDLDPKYVAFNAGIQISAQVQKQLFPQSAKNFEDTPDSLKADIFYRGFVDGAVNDTTNMVLSDAAHFMKESMDAAKKAKNAAYIAENTKWLAENKTKEGVVVLPSGLQYKVITTGTGKVAQKDDNVTVKYEGKMIDGTVFDSSYKRNPDTTSFKPTQVIKGWTEALCMMPEGSKWELYIPQELAYGERQAGKIKPYSTLIFTVEVVKVGE